MPILSVQANNPGQAGVVPNLVYIETNDSLSKVMSAGYLTDAAVAFGFSAESMLLVSVVPASNADAALVWLAPTNVNGVWSAVNPPAGSGNNPGTTGQLGRYNTNGTVLTGATLIAGANVTITNTPPGDITISSTAGGGGVNPGLQFQMAYYASNGSQLSGLITTSAAVLVSTGVGVPVWSNALNDGQLLIGTTGGQPAVANLTAGSNITITNGPGIITIDATGGGSGTVNAGTMNQLAYYASNGTTVSPLPVALPVPAGGTGVGTFTPFAVVLGGNAPTGNLQDVGSVGLAGQALLSQGAGLVPVWGNVASVPSPTTIGHIATYISIGGALGQDPVTAFTNGGLQTGGDIQAGSSAVSGGLISYPASGASGHLELYATNSPGDFNTFITNEALGQSSTYTLKDPGGAGNTDFILSNTLAGVQTINSFLTVSSGNVISGNNTGVQGKFKAFSPSAGFGNLTLEASDNVGTFDIVVTNASFTQSSTISLPDVGGPTANFILSDANAVQHIRSQLIVDSGLVDSGVNGTAGLFRAFAPSVGGGSLAIGGGDNLGNFFINILNEPMGQDTLLLLPDAGKASTHFILQDTLAANQTINSGLFVNSGRVESGDPAGVVGSFKAYSPTGARGSLALVASDNTAAFDVIITNDGFAAGAQVNIPDTGDANQSFAVFGLTTPPVVGNVVKVVGARGVVGDAGFAMRPNIEVAAAGGSPTQNFLDAFCTTASVVIGTWVTQANPASILTIVPNNGSFDVTSTTDAGVGTFSYVIYK